MARAEESWEPGQVWIKLCLGQVIDLLGAFEGRIHSRMSSLNVCVLCQMPTFITLFYSSEKRGIRKVVNNKLITVINSSFLQVLSTKDFLSEPYRRKNAHDVARGRDPRIKARRL